MNKILNIILDAKCNFHASYLIKIGAILECVEIACEV